MYCPWSHHSQVTLRGATLVSVLLMKPLHTNLNTLLWPVAYVCAALTFQGSSTVAHLKLDTKLWIWLSSSHIYWHNNEIQVVKVPRTTEPQPNSVYICLLDFANSGTGRDRGESIFLQICWVNTWANHRSPKLFKTVHNTVNAVTCGGEMHTTKHNTLNKLNKIKIKNPVTSACHYTRLSMPAWWMLVSVPVFSTGDP